MSKATLRVGGSACGNRALPGRKHGIGGEAMRGTCPAGKRGARAPWARGLALALGVAALTACGQPPEFATPLSDPGKVDFDRRVFGRWHMQKEPWYVHIEPDGGDAKTADRLRIGLAILGPKGASSYVFSAHASTLDGKVYFNVRRNRTAYTWDYTAPGKEPGYIILRVFPLTDDAILVCGLLGLPKGSRPKHWREWYAGRLQGSGLTPRFAEVVPRLNGHPVAEKKTDGMLHTLVEGSSEDLIGFVRANPAENFRAMMLLVRVGTKAPSGRDKALLEAKAQEYRQECKVKL